jgi:hypothetical protein
MLSNSPGSIFIHKHVQMLLAALELKAHVVSVEVMKYSSGSVNLREGSGRRLWGLERGSAGTGD